MSEFYDDLETMDEEYEIEDVEDLIEDEMDDDYLLIREVLDQNVETQHLPSEDRFDVLEGEGRNALYRLKDDATVQLYDRNSKEYEMITGEEFNQRLMDEYGMDSVYYSNGEADFSNYTSTIHKSDIQELIDDEVDKEFNGYGILDKSGDSVERYGEFGTINEAYEIIANELECDIDDVKTYLKENNLVIHEEGMNGFEVIPDYIHNTFRHTGSIGIKKDLNALCEAIHLNEDTRYALVEEHEGGYCDNLEEAIQGAIERNKQVKSDLYKK